jgi:hypothetical protein
MALSRIPSACLGLFATMAMAAACLPDPVPAVERQRGHEETPLPTARPGPFPKASEQKPASRVAEPSVPKPSLPGCRSIEERIASIAKAAPDAQASHVSAEHVATYVDAFNKMHGTAHQADEVAIVTSTLWGDLALVLFEQRGCEAGTEQISFSAPGSDDER